MSDANNDIKHTKEPWEIWNDPAGSPIIKSIWRDGKNRRCTTFVAETLDMERSFHDAKRIVAAVNFCEGYGNESLIAGEAVIVPKEPTEEMLEAGFRIFADSGLVEETMEADKLVLEEIYKAMTESK